MLFFGRIHPDKGAAEAIAAARGSGRRLVMAGIIQDGDYHNAHVAPALVSASIPPSKPAASRLGTTIHGRGPTLDHAIVAGIHVVLDQ